MKPIIRNNYQAPEFSHKQIQTLGELKAVLPETGSAKAPGIQQLRATSIPILQENTDCGTIEVYDNGFYLYIEGKRFTVDGVDRIKKLAWHFCNDEVSFVEGEALDQLPWPIPLEITGANRIQQNAANTVKQHEPSQPNDPASVNSLAFSVKPEHEARELWETEEECKAHRCQLIASEFARLRSSQRELLQLLLEGRTKSDIAMLLHTDPSDISHRIARIASRFEKYL